MNWMCSFTNLGTAEFPKKQENFAYMHLLQTFPWVTNRCFFADMKSTMRYSHVTKTTIKFTMKLVMKDLSWTLVLCVNVGPQSFLNRIEAEVGWWIDPLVDEWNTVNCGKSCNDDRLKVLLHYGFRWFTGIAWISPDRHQFGSRWSLQLHKHPIYTTHVHSIVDQNSTIGKEQKFH